MIAEEGWRLLRGREPDRELAAIDMIQLAGRRSASSALEGARARPAEMLLHTYRPTHIKKISTRYISLIQPKLKHLF
jgi:hypothetical protein